MECLYMETGSEMRSSLDREGFTENTVSDHRPDSVEGMAQAVETTLSL